MSRDAGLPDWSELVERLLQRTASSRGGFSPEAEALWIEQTMERDHSSSRTFGRSPVPTRFFAKPLRRWKGE